MKHTRFLGWKNAVLAGLVAGSLVVACGGDDDVIDVGAPGTDAGATQDASVPAPDAAADAAGGDAGTLVDAADPQDAAPAEDAASDAGVLDAGSPVDSGADSGPLPPGVQECVSCALDDCGPSLSQCYNDEVCRGLMTCAVTSGCLLNDPSSCVPTCVAQANLNIFEALQQALNLTKLVTSCSGCLTDCGLDGAL